MCAISFAVDFDTIAAEAAANSLQQGFAAMLTGAIAKAEAKALVFSNTTSKALYTVGDDLRWIARNAAEIDLALGGDSLDQANARLDRTKTTLAAAKKEAEALAEAIRQEQAAIGSMDSHKIESLAAALSDARKKETAALHAYNAAQRAVTSEESKRSQQEQAAISRSQSLFGALNELRGMFGDLRDVFEITAQPLLGFSDAQQKAAEHMAYATEKGAMLGLASAELGERLGLSAKNALSLGAGLGALGVVSSLVLSAYSEHVKRAKDATDALAATRAALSEIESDYSKRLREDGVRDLALIEKRVLLLSQQKAETIAATEANVGFWQSTAEWAAGVQNDLDDYAGGWGLVATETSRAVEAAAKARQQVTGITAETERVRGLARAWQEGALAAEDHLAKLSDTWVALYDLGRVKSIDELRGESEAAQVALASVQDRLVAVRKTLDAPIGTTWFAALKDQAAKAKALLVELPALQKEASRASSEALSAESAYQSKRKESASAAASAAKQEKEDKQRALDKEQERREVQALSAVEAQLAADARAAQEQDWLMRQGDILASVKASALAEANARREQAEWWATEGRSIGEERQRQQDEYLASLKAEDARAALKAIEGAVTDLGNVAVRELSGRAAKAATDFFDRLSDPRVSLAEQKRAAKEARAASLKELGSVMIGEGVADELRALTAAALGNFATAGALAGVGAAKVAFGFGLGGVGARQARKLGGGSAREARGGSSSGGGGLDGGRIRGVSEAARGPQAPTVINVTVQSLTPANQAAWEEAGATISQALSAHSRSGA